MSSQMNVKSIFSRILLLADDTFERLIARMYKLMSFQMTFSNELLSTAWNWAYERSVSGLLNLKNHDFAYMSPQMCLEVTCLCERF